MRTTNEYEVRVYTQDKEEMKYRGSSKGAFSTLEEADKHLEHKGQCTWDDIEEQRPKAYSVIFHYRDDEHYADHYFINYTK